MNEQAIIPTDITINSWDDIKPYFEKLDTLQIDSKQNLEKLILAYSKVLSVFYEQNAWAYIKMTCNTTDEALVKRHEVFATEIQPQISAWCNKIQKKMAQSPFFKNLDSDRYGPLVRDITRDLEMFREENLAIEAEISKLSSAYGQLAGSLTVKIDGEEMPLPKASPKLQSANRAEREDTWKAVGEARLAAKEKHDEILNQMVKLRHQLALNAGYKNYRDFKHDDMHRFDYTVDDVLTFHEAIKEVVNPLNKMVMSKHFEKMDLQPGEAKPWDTSGQPKGLKPLEPFKDGKELLEKTISIFTKIRPSFGENLKKMKAANLFDLDSRKGKAPGGYNYGLEVTGMPFIFMNAAGVHRDVVTLMHEGGHAMHTFAAAHEPLIQYRNTPSEMAETASMSMELMTSNYWNLFYNEEDLKRARREHLEGIISVFPWVAIVDSFQHWLYTNPEHTVEARDNYFKKLMEDFGTGLVDWTGFEDHLKNQWQKQLHIFEVPFYYIEYAIAQLGALQIYKQYVENPEKAIDNYLAGLSLGSSKPLPQVWEAMGIRFDFSKKNLKDLMGFVKEQWESLN